MASVIDFIGDTPLIEITIDAYAIGAEADAQTAVASEGRSTLMDRRNRTFEPSGQVAMEGRSSPTDRESGAYANGEKTGAQTSPRKGARVFAKAEYFNPGGSIKDRAAKAMLLDGIKSGALTKDKTIIDATSGNTGIAYAMIGAALGYKVVLYMPANASIERKTILRRYGAQIVPTDPLASSDGAFLRAKEEAESNPDKYFYPNQYHNPQNPLAHYNGTGVEIWNQTKGRVTHFVAMSGTCGTFCGTTKRLKELNRDIVAINVQPDSPFHGIEGVKHMQSTLKSGFYDETLVDRFAEVSTEEAYATTRRLAKEAGLYVGISSGANVFAALRLAAELSSDEIVVTILNDNGFRYASDSFWEER
ncbi:MAG: cysteine synthase family protein [Helicobacteraceae bacterium]|jgi:cysteine synthase B|nr:cysteine synthase family protein [Helicobacteraceae bacterium]